MYETLDTAEARSLGDGQVKSMTLCRGESETQCAGEQRVCQHARVQARITAHDHERGCKCARANGCVTRRVLTLRSRPEPGFGPEGTMFAPAQPR